MPENTNLSATSDAQLTEKNIQSDAFVVGAIVTGIAAAVTSIVNTHKTNKANRELWREQTQHNEEYNDPSAIRDRLLNAGYSPLLGQVGSPIMATGANPSQQTNTASDSLSNMGLTIPNALKGSSESALIDEQKRGLEIENNKKEEKINADIRKIYKDMDLEDAQIANLTTSQSKMKAEIDALNKTQEREDFIAKSNKEFQDWQKKNGSEKTKIDWFNAKVNEALVDSQTGLNVQQQEALRAKISETAQHIELMAQQGENIEADTIQKDMDNFIRKLVFRDEIAEAKENTENSRKLAKLRNNAFVRSVELTSKVFGSLLGGVGAAAVVAGSKTGSTSHKPIGFKQ